MAPLLCSVSTALPPRPCSDAAGRLHAFSQSLTSQVGKPRYRADLPGSASRKVMSSWWMACAYSSRCAGYSSANGTDWSRPVRRKRSAPPSHACLMQLLARSAGHS